MEVCQRRAKQTVRQRAQPADGDPPTLPAVGQPRRRDPLVEHADRAPGIRQKARAQRGQADTAAVAREQRPAQLLLQRLDAGADRRLRDRERPRGAAEAALAHDPLEGDQLIDIHDVR